MTPIVLAERAIAAVGAGRQLEVRQVPGAPELLQPVRDRALAVRAQAFGPEAAGHLDVAGRERPQPGDRRRRRPDGHVDRGVREHASGGHFSGPAREARDVVLLQQQVDPDARDHRDRDPGLEHAPIGAAQAGLGACRGQDQRQREDRTPG